MNDCIWKMDSKEGATIESIEEKKKQIVYYNNQKNLATQKLSIVRQKLEDIDHYFSNYGYYYEFNVMTQIAAHERAKEEDNFDRITSDLYHFNKRLAELNDELHILYNREFAESL